MRITADTNLLVRAIVEDHPTQSKAAQAELAAADLVAIPTIALCELIWVLSQGYKLPGPLIAQTVRRLTDSANVAVERAAVEVGLAMLDHGGDFADGVIAYDGQWLGADTFVSFDRRAVTLAIANDVDARLLPG